MKSAPPSGPSDSASSENQVIRERRSFRNSVPTTWPNIYPAPARQPHEVGLQVLLRQGQVRQVESGFDQGARDLGAPVEPLKEAQPTLGRPLDRRDAEALGQQPGRAVRVAHFDFEVAARPAPQFGVVEFFEAGGPGG